MGMRRIYTAAELLEQGYGYREMGKLGMRHPRRGVWVPDKEPGTPTTDYLTLIEGTRRQVRPGVLAGPAAAALHGLPLPYAAMHSVHLIRDAPHYPFTARHLTVRIAPLGPDDVVEVDGVPVTSLARTVADLARTLPAPWVVAAGDAALAKGLEPEALEACLDAMTRVPGRRRACRLLRLLDARSGSAGESVSRYLIVAAGLPPPELQWEFVTAGKAEYADMHWDLNGGVAGEFDGYGKYCRELPDGSVDPARRLFAEKQREDRLRRKVRYVERWGWAEVRRPDDFIAPLAEALALPFVPYGSRAPW